MISDKIPLLESAFNGLQNWFIIWNYYLIIFKTFWWKLSKLTVVIKICYLSNTSKIILFEFYSSKRLCRTSFSRNFWKKSNSILPSSLSNNFVLLDSNNVKIAFFGTFDNIFGGLVWIISGSTVTNSFYFGQYEFKNFNC